MFREDGYILTCAHTDHLPGEQFTVRLSDGRDADAVALGTNPITDIGLVKITTPGSWPFAEIAESSTLKPGDPLVVAGYPAIDLSLRKSGQQNEHRKLTQRLCDILCTCCGATNSTPDQIDAFPQGGMSGGGVFNQHGRYVAVFYGTCPHPVGSRQAAMG